MKRLPDLGPVTSYDDPFISTDGPPTHFTAQVVLHLRPEAFRTHGDALAFVESWLERAVASAGDVEVAAEGSGLTAEELKESQPPAWRR